MFRHFSAFDLLPRVLLTRLRWIGPALAAAGVFAAAAVAYAAKQNSFAAWFLAYALAPERAFPLIGLGIACGLVGAPVFALALALFGLGIASGMATHDWLILAIYTALEGTTHLSLTSPIGCLAIGLALLSGVRLLVWLLPFCAFIEGVTLAVAVFLTDPSLHNSHFIWAPLLAAIWIVVGVALTLQAFRGRWSPIFARIVGSWLVTVGLLYGGASLLPILKPSPPPEDTSLESIRGAELKESLHPPAGPEQFERLQPEPDTFSGGAGRLPPQ